MRNKILILCVAILTSTGASAAEQFHIADPIEKNNMTIQPNYFTGVKMESLNKDMAKTMAMDDKAIHLQVDIHAAKGEPHGFGKGSWIPYLKITYKIEKLGSDFHKAGQLLPMTAKGGTHYANNIDMDGPGQYHLTYEFEPPSVNGFIRHIDKATGVPEWWAPFMLDWTFEYPIKTKAN